MPRTTQRPAGSLLLSDVDGVLLDSFANHARVTGGLLRLLGHEFDLVDRADEKRRFGLAAFTDAYGKHIAEALIAARPALMAATVERSPVFTDMVDAITNLRIPVVLVTAGHASAVRARLGDDASRFEAILGCETGDKSDLLLQYAGAAHSYITDTAADVIRCGAVGIPVVGVAWGFDCPEELRAAGAEVVIDEPGELRAVFAGAGR